MKTLIHEIGVIDKQGNKHPVNFKKGLNIITGRSSTGKSALIEILDYCFGSSENTIPKGVISDNAMIYYVALAVNHRNIIIARHADDSKKAFLRNAENFTSELIQLDYFDKSHFVKLSDFKKALGGEFGIDISDSDTSYFAKEHRGRKNGTPTIRSFCSFALQHQNLIANKHAIFYRFDEKHKRDEVIEHTKYYLGLVDQNFFLLSQEQERLEASLKALRRQEDANKRASDNYRQNVEPILSQLYAMMGFKEAPLSLQAVLRNPQDAKNRLDKIIVPEKINHSSNAATQHYQRLNLERTKKTSELRKLQRQAGSIEKHIQEEERFVENVNKFSPTKQVHISELVCPFCHTENNTLRASAEKLQQAIAKVSGNLAQARPMKAKFQALSVEIHRSIEILDKELIVLGQQIAALEKTEKELAEQKSLYESILIQKARLFALLDTLNIADDAELEEQIKGLNNKLKDIIKKLKKYDVQKGLEIAAEKVNLYMSEIGKNFDFEESYQPINLRFSFETFDLYHLQGEEKIYLRSMGSGANWLYCHVTLFLALHKYFAELGDSCAIPSILFFDQPTQVYFPNFNRDNSATFEEQKAQEAEQRKQADVQQNVDDDIKAVENLFTHLSIYCNELERDNGFSPQIIVTDHADNLRLKNGVEFESLVNGNRWRTRGLIYPIPVL